MQLKAVLFDLFETLVTEYDEGKRTAKRAYPYREQLGLDTAQFKQEWGRRQRERMTGEFADYAAVVKHILQERGLPYREAAVEQLYRQRIEEKLTPFRQVSPQIVHMLASLRSAGFKLGLISNCTEEEVRGWDSCELTPYFDSVLFSYRFGLAKPDQDIYLRACDSLGVLPGEAAFAGDGGSDELDGAHRAGMAAVYHVKWFQSGIESDYPALYEPEQLLRSLGMPLQR